MKRQRSADDPAGRSAGGGLKRAAVGALGWALTAIGVLAILVLVGGGPGGLSPSVGTIVAAAVGVSVLVPAALGIAYLVVRSRNRAAEATGGRTLVTPRARATQTGLAALLDRVDADDALGLRRVVLTDRVQLTATGLADIDDRWDALSFIWMVRPSQVADFPQSPQFQGLPAWAQDAVVLLDLRRDLQLRGAAASLTAETGFYHHPYERTLQTAARTGNSELTAALLAAREAAVDHRESGAHTQRMLASLDDVRTWERVLG